MTQRTSVLRQNIHNSMAEGAAFSLMVGLGETYFSAFILSVGLGEIAAGLISTLPLVSGALLQLVSPLMVARLRSYRKWVLCCATVQALSFLPFIHGAATGRLSVVCAFVVASVYWGFGMGAGSAWNSWVGTLVPGRLQTSFFTRRSLWIQITSLTGFVAGGLALNWWPPGYSPSSVFSLLFSAALLCRLLSIFWLGRQSEPVPPACQNMRMVLPKEFFQRVRAQGQLGRALTYFLLVQLTAQIGSPYFTPYMLSELHFSYSAYAVLIGASFLTKILVLPRLGKVAVGQGARSLLWLGGVGIVLLPALWLLSSNFYFLISLQVLSGFFWAAYDLAALLLILELIKPEDRTPLLTGYNCLNAAAVVIGSLAGAAILKTFGTSAEAYIVVFSFSAAGRALTLIWLSRVSYQRTGGIPFSLRPILLRPSLGFHGVPLSYNIRNWRDRLRQRQTPLPVAEPLAQTRSLP